MLYLEETTSFLTKESPITYTETVRDSGPDKGSMVQVFVKCLRVLLMFLRDSVFNSGFGYQFRQVVLVKVLKWEETKELNLKRISLVFI